MERGKKWTRWSDLVHKYWTALLIMFHLHTLSRYLFTVRYSFNSEVFILRTMDNSTTNTVPSKEAVNVNLIEGFYSYLTDAWYLKGYTTANKRAIRKKEQKFVV